MNQPTRGAEIPAKKSDTTPGLLGVACGLGAALFWALGFVATRHGLKAGFTPVDLLMHRFLWSGLVFLPFVFRAGLRDLCGIGWGRGMVLMVLGGPVMSLISYAGFLFVPLGHGSVIQPSCATLGGLLFAAFLLHERIAPSRVVGALVIVAGLGVIGGESIAHIGLDGVHGDLIFVLTGMMFAGFGTLVRYWRVSAVSVAVVISVLSLLLFPAYALSGGLSRHRGARSSRECIAGGGAGHPVRTRGDVSVHRLDPASRRRPRRDLPGDGAGADAAVQLAAARRAADALQMAGLATVLFGFYLAQRQR